MVILLLCRVLQNQPNSHCLLQGYRHFIHLQNAPPTPPPMTHIHGYYCWMLTGPSMEHKEQQSQALPLPGEPSPQREFAGILTPGKRGDDFYLFAGSQRCSEQKTFSYVLLFFPFKTRAAFPQTCYHFEDALKIF